MGDATALAKPPARRRLSLGGTKTPARLGFSTPARRKLAARSPDPEEMASFFRQRSARLDSPIFARDQYCQKDYARSAPQVRFCAQWKEKDHVPEELQAECIGEAVFDGVKPVQIMDADLSWRVARNPLPYSLRIKFDTEGNTYPVSARLTVVPDSVTHMFVLARPQLTDEEEDLISTLENAAEYGHHMEEYQSLLARWFWTHPAHREEEELDVDTEVDEFVLRFWAAPSMELRRGKAELKLEILDSKNKSHFTRFTMQAKGCEPTLQVTGSGINFNDNSKTGKIVFTEGVPQFIDVVNVSQRDASVLAAVYVEENGVFPKPKNSEQGAFLMYDREHPDACANEAVKLLKAGEKIELEVNFRLPAYIKKIPVCFHGYLVVRIAYFLSNKLDHDEDLPQYYDHVIYLEAPREDGVPVAYSPHSETNSPYSNKIALRNSIEPNSGGEAMLSPGNELPFENDLKDNLNFSSSLFFEGEDHSFEANEITETAQHGKHLGMIGVDEQALDGIDDEEDLCRNLQHSDEQSTVDWPTPFRGTPFKMGSNKDGQNGGDKAEHPFSQPDSFAALWEQQPISTDDDRTKDTEKVYGEYIAQTSRETEMLYGNLMKYETGEEEGAQKWHHSPTDIQAAHVEQRKATAKLRMVRGVRTRGVRIASDSNYQVLPLQNGSPCVVEVQLGLRGSAIARFDSQIITLDPGAKAKVRIVRRSPGTANIRITVTPFDEQLSVVHYSVALAVDARKVKPARVALDRPTLTFYAPRDNTSTARIRILNGLHEETPCDARIRDVDPVTAGNPFVIDNCASAIVPAGAVFDAYVRFDVDGPPAQYRAHLDVRGNGHADSVPIFAYSGTSWITCTLDDEGVVHATNHGDRAAYILVDYIGVIVMASDTELIHPSGDWDGLVSCGDEIARSRLRVAHRVGASSWKEFENLSPYLEEFEGEDVALLAENLVWDNVDDKSSLHYAARLFAAGMTCLSEKNGVFVTSEVDEATRWDAYFDQYGRVRLYNGSTQNPLRYRVTGALPARGIIPELGDGALFDCQDSVTVRARGRTVTLCKSQYTTT